MTYTLLFNANYTINNLQSYLDINKHIYEENVKAIFLKINYRRKETKRNDKNLHIIIDIIEDINNLISNI